MNPQASINLAHNKGLGTAYVHGWYFILAAFRDTQKISFSQ